VNHVVAHGELLPFAYRLAADTASTDQDALRAIYGTYDEGSKGTRRDTLRLEAEVNARWHAQGIDPGQVTRRRAAVIERGRAQRLPGSTAEIRRRGMDIYAVIAKGEGPQVEFKASMRFPRGGVDLHPNLTRARRKAALGGKHAILEKMALKTIAAWGLLRYRLLETIRLFAAERLVEAGDGEAAAIGAAHCAHLVAAMKLPCCGCRIPGRFRIRPPTTYHGALTRLLPVRTVLR
jgi:hypothetical protein